MTAENCEHAKGFVKKKNIDKLINISGMKSKMCIKNEYYIIKVEHLI